ncbi:hypothetical protein [Nocardioides lijunqiniae]|uniref:hypothetical protein n=1 Tax=Nocardioides lijunqiniae TaxID=2760832 RepID=UPI001877C7F7|nr:hypothetical protein [Nocardioides lijunqiniae]
MKRTVLIVVAAIVLVLIGGGAWALTRGDDETVERGTCGATSYELSVEKDDEGLEVAYELQSGAPDETWSVVMEQGDSTLLEGERRTDEDAELDLDVVAKESGSDTFTVTATPAEGEPCTATLTR